MVVLQVGSENSLQVSGVQHDHVVKALAAYRADDAFAIRILPRRMRRGRDFFDAYASDAFPEVAAVDTIAVADEKTWSFLVREGVDDLLGGLFGVGIRGDIEVDDPPAVVAKHDEDVQHTEGHGRHDEEIAGGDVGQVIV